MNRLFNLDNEFEAIMYDGACGHFFVDIGFEPTINDFGSHFTSFLFHRHRRDLW